jgi:hypothetical protein
MLLEMPMTSRPKVVGLAVLLSPLFFACGLSRGASRLPDGSTLVGCTCPKTASHNACPGLRCNLCATRFHAPAQHDMSNMEHHHSMLAPFYGDYPMTREATGTSWQPDSSPHSGVHFMKGDWALMLHGYGQVIYDHQGGPRGADKTFSSNMLMLMGTRAAGKGTFGFRAMLSAEPLTIGSRGYPLLLQNGETADGRTPLTDRQHPHDLLMELAATYSRPVAESTSVFAYFGLPGEPALGPPAFMHRYSGEEIPAAPIAHHWLDSTHISFGVATFGVVRKNLKIEGSLFNGREPDQHRYDFDRPRFNSYAFRVSYNPAKNWSFQTSFGHLKSPEQLEPAVNQNRVTASATYNRKTSGYDWQTTFAWGRDINKPGRALNAFLLESTLGLAKKHTVFGRVERVAKDELFQEPDPLAGQSFNVGEGTFGYVYDFAQREHFSTGLGGLLSIAFVPDALRNAYSSTPVSTMIFLRLRLK